MHDIKTTSFEIDIPLIAYVEAIYSTYSNYLESLQASGNLKEIIFDSIEKMFAEREKGFGKKTTPQSSKDVACLRHKEKNQTKGSSRGRGGRRGRGRRNFRSRGGREFEEEDSTCNFPWGRLQQEINEDKGKTNDKGKGKRPTPTHYVVAHCNNEVTKDLFNASFSSWKDDWLLDLGPTCHMNFRRDFFEEFTGNFDGVVYFADKSKLKPLGLDTIRLKLPSLPGFLLHDFLYIPELRRNLLSLVHIY